ncbi:C-C chemokine receptor type 6a [Melanotaenia boesemani]|uniref:C-C chemokine receptor type 6a n=1 Tax=Melanotaenia boesemani TaxID=1250792 RepID=UPI001C0454CF|nr:C-C chemokine receptor type 6a [Melanotaenia boesemani]
MSDSTQDPKLNDSTSYSDFSDYYNYTEYPGELVPPCLYSMSHSVSSALGLYVHPIICILGFVGNSLVIITYALYKKTKSMTDVYLLNVAIADLLFVLALPFLVYNERSSWSMGPVACKLLRGSYSVNLYSGMLLLACISTDRYIAIVQARRSFRLRSLSYSRLICAVIWTFAILVSVPTFYFYQFYQPTHFRPFMMVDDEDEDQTSSPPRYVCELRFEDRDTALKAKVAIPSTQLAVGFFLPLFIMIFCYASIIVTLMKAKNFQRHKAVRVVLAVVVVFIVCHLPYNLVLLCDTVKMFQLDACSALDAWKTALAVMQSVAYLHCCLNPVLYAFIGVKFRNHFRRIFQDLWCVSKKYITPRRFSRVTSEIYMSSVRRSVDVSSDTGSSFTM